MQAGRIIFVIIFLKFVIKHTHLFGIFVIVFIVKLCFSTRCTMGLFQALFRDSCALALNVSPTVVLFLTAKCALPECGRQDRRADIHAYGF